MTFKAHVSMSLTRTSFAPSRSVWWLMVLLPLTIPLDDLAIKDFNKYIHKLAVVYGAHVTNFSYFHGTAKLLTQDGVWEERTDRDVVGKGFRFDRSFFV